MILVKSLKLCVLLLKIGDLKTYLNGTAHEVQVKSCI